MGGTRGHKKLLEQTNGGCYFADCGCGVSLGVYGSRFAAGEAHAAHVEGRDTVGKIPPVVQLSPPAFVCEDGELYPVPPCMDKLVAVDRRPSGAVLKAWDHIIAAREER